MSLIRCLVGDNERGEEFSGLSHVPDPEKMANLFFGRSLIRCVVTVTADFLRVLRDLCHKRARIVVWL